MLRCYHIDRLTRKGRHSSVYALSHGRYATQSHSTTIRNENVTYDINHNFRQNHWNISKDRLHLDDIIKWQGQLNHIKPFIEPGLKNRNKTNN